MSEVTTIGLDIAKNVFHAHGADAGGSPLFSRKISRTAAAVQIGMVSAIFVIACFPSQRRQRPGASPALRTTWYGRISGWPSP